MFGATADAADERAFAERCADDRHHFRFIVSPEDAAEMENLRTFAHELMADVERDLGTRLDWVAVDHWNTDNPHVHVLVRGRAEDGQDIVISRDYISRGFSGRAAERVTLELGRAASRRSVRPWRGRSRQSAGPASTGGCRTYPMRAAASSICTPEAPVKTRSCAA